MLSLTEGKYGEGWLEAILLTLCRKRLGSCTFAQLPPQIEREKRAVSKKGGFGECTLVPVFGGEEHVNVPSFWCLVPEEHPNVCSGSWYRGTSAKATLREYKIAPSRRSWKITQRLRFGPPTTVLKITETLLKKYTSVFFTNFGVIFRTVLGGPNCNFCVIFQDFRGWGDFVFSKGNWDPKSRFCSEENICALSPNRSHQKALILFGDGHGPTWGLGKLQV